MISELKPVALILDAHLKSALAAIRSLGQKGISVIAGAERPTAMGLHSNYASKTFVYPSPYSDRDRFTRFVLDLAKSIEGPLVPFTFSDATFMALYECRDHMDGFLPVFPGCDFDVTRAYDKAETMRLARQLGIEVPRSIGMRHLLELESRKSACVYPLVIKPRRSTVLRNGAAVQVAPLLGFSFAETKNACADIHNRTGEFPLIQEHISGEELGAEFLCDNGRVLAEFAHRRVRSLSPSGGASVVKQSVPRNYRGIGDLGKSLVEKLHWSGPVMVEFKVDRRDHRPKLLEINGRFWGSLPLAVAAGVDFPWLYFCLATGTPIPPANRYAEWVTSRHWLGDLGHVARVLVSQDPLRGRAYPKRMAAVRNFLLPSPGTRSDVIRSDDLSPAFAEINDALWRIAQRFFHRGKQAFGFPSRRARKDK